MMSKMREQKVPYSISRNTFLPAGNGENNNMDVSINSMMFLKISDIKWPDGYTKPQNFNNNFYIPAYFYDPNIEEEVDPNYYSTKFKLDTYIEFLDLWGVDRPDKREDCCEIWCDIAPPNNESITITVSGVEPSRFSVSLSSQTLNTNNNYRTTLTVIPADVTTWFETYQKSIVISFNCSVTSYRKTLTLNVCVFNIG